MHEDLSSKHVVQAPRVLLQQFLVVFAREIIDKDLEPPNRVIFQHIASTSCILLATELGLAQKWGKEYILGFSTMLGMSGSYSTLILSKVYDRII